MNFQRASLPPFTIVRKLGEGGFGKVMLARDRASGRLFALKELHRPDDGQYLTRFRHEIQAIRALAHPNVVRLEDWGEGPNGPWYSMEYVGGGSLDKLWWVTLETKIAAVEQIAAGLGHAHAHGVIHRDLKPANILCDGKGNFKLSDFGCCRFGGFSLGITRGAIGTPGFWAPEQEATGFADARSDLFSLGVIVHKLFFGSMPTWNGQGELLQWPGYDSTPESMRVVVVALLQRNPRARYQSVGLLMDDFALAASDLVAQKKANQKALLKGAGVVAGVLVAGVGLAAVARGR